MMNRHVQILALVLVMLGLSIFTYKALIVGFPILPGQLKQAWDIEARFQFNGTGEPVKATTFVPRSRPGLQVYGERFIAKDYGLAREETVLNRRVVLATRAARGKQTLYVKFLVHRSRQMDDGEPAPEPRIIDPGFDDASQAEAQDLVSQARARSADTQTFVTALLKSMRDQQTIRAADHLLGRAKYPGERASAAVAVLASAHIAARRVNGINLASDQKSAQLVRWLEVYDAGIWRSFSVDSGENSVPASYMPWWYGIEPFITVAGGIRPSRTISFVQVQEHALDNVLAEGRREGSQVVTLSLFGLPLATQQVYRILTVVPLGIFLLVIIRNVIGLRTLGTFMPVLIALALRETKLVWGVVLFSSVVGAGLLFRAYLEHLKLLLVPRLASVLIFVVMFMAGLSVVSAQLGFQGGLSVALFPMVIMTITIERVSVIWDELGPQAALRQASASLGVAALCYLVMSQDIVQHLFFTFPELLLVLLAGTLLLGRYSGYRLLELLRFKVLAGDDR